MSARKTSALIVPAKLSFATVILAGLAGEIELKTTSQEVNEMPISAPRSKTNQQASPRGRQLLKPRK